MARKTETSNTQQQPSRSFASRLPAGVKLVRTWEGGEEIVYSLAFDPTGLILAKGSSNKTLSFWNIASGELLRIIESHQDSVRCLAFDPTGRTIASGSSDGTVKLWEMTSGRLLHTFGGHSLEHSDSILSLAFDPELPGLACGCQHGKLAHHQTSTGKQGSFLNAHHGFVTGIVFDPVSRTLVSSSNDGSIKVWDRKSRKLLRTLEGHSGAVWSLIIDPRSQTVISGGEDRTIKMWEAATGKLLRTLEGHTDHVDAVALSANGLLLASKSRDGTVRIWNCDTWETIAVIPEPTRTDLWIPGLAFHPTLQRLVSVGSKPDAPGYELSRHVHLWELDVKTLLPAKEATPTVHYVNAKVVLVGDTGVGKTGLSLVLNGKPFQATDSTPGRHVWTFDSREVEVEVNRKETRETLLWDLAGQPGYRVIHQLHLNEVAVALIVFDARSETDPLAGVRHWERALRLAHQRQGSHLIPMKKILVSARTDRGSVSVSRDRLETIIKEFGFDDYFETSAKQGWQIQELIRAITVSIPWNDLPVVTSSELFASIKESLLEVKKTGRLLATESVLYDEFAHRYPEFAAKHENLAAQFETCIGRLETRDLIRRLSFGGYVLLQPELLDAYASAMVNAAKTEPDGLGSIAEELALAGKFHVPEEQKIKDRKQEQLLLHATVEELVMHDLALRENADDGRYLVFPSQFNRDYEDAPEPKGKALALTFEGPVQSLYSTLAVRLGHSGLFETGRTEMWRNAAVFTARAGGKCGFYMREFAEAHGQLLIFFGAEASDETRFHFEEYIWAHFSRRALVDTISLTRFFICPGCSTPVPDAYVDMTRRKGLRKFDCPCGGSVSLAEPKDKLQYASKVEVMDKTADRKRDFEAFVVSANAETHTNKFVGWAGGERVTLAIAFTDIVGSTALGREIGDERMTEIRNAHFAQGRKILDRHNGREIKTIGDSLMVAFHSVDEALDFALSLSSSPGDSRVQIRVGIHVGALTVEGSDVFGGTVNFAARVVAAIKGPDIWLSARAKEDVDSLRAERHTHITWERHDDVIMKGFTGKYTLWSLTGIQAPEIHGEGEISRQKSLEGPVHSLKS